MPNRKVSVTRDGSGRDGTEDVEIATMMTHRRSTKTGLHALMNSRGCFFTNRTVGTNDQLPREAIGNHGLYVAPLEGPDCTYKYLEARTRQLTATL